MEKSQKRSLREDVQQDVEQIEREIAEHPELEHIRVTEEMDAALRAKIREYGNAKAIETKNSEKMTLEKSVSEESMSLDTILDKRATQGDMQLTSRDGVKVKHKKKRIRWIAVLAAVLILVLGLGMTSVGSKSYWKELLDVLIGNESARVINVEDMETQKTEDLDELFVYQEIGEKLGQRPVWMRYKPKHMRLTEYEIDENLQMARLVFDYQGNFIRYTMYASQEDSSWTDVDEDEIISEYIMEVEGTEIIVNEIERANQTERTKAARFEYEGIYYELKGLMEKAEFEKILQNLFFL